MSMPNEGTMQLFSDAGLTRRMKPWVTETPADYVPEVLPNTGEKLNVTIEWDHAYEVLDTLMARHSENGFPYNQDRVRLPQDPRHMPETLVRGTTDHAMFWFNVCYYMRGGIKSNDAVKRLSRMYDTWPELFNAEIAQDFDQELLEQILTENGLGFQKTVAKQWTENSRRLVERYDGDPRLIFEGVETYEESQERVQNKGKEKGFIGFQEKMTSMIIYYLMDEDLIEPFNFPIPVDLHVMRVSIANEMITFGDIPHKTNLFTDETLAALRELYFTYAHERQVNPLRLCDAVWMLSESSCGKHPGNTTIEPRGRAVRQGRGTYLIPKVVDDTDPGQHKAYNESCRQCPLDNTCNFNLPGTPYYVGGSLYIRGRRFQFPWRAIIEAPQQEKLFEILETTV